MTSLHAFAEWLGSTPLSLTIQNVVWIIPTMQSIHILGISVVIFAAMIVDLRLLGVVGRGNPTAAYMERFLPTIWWTVIVLFLTGAVLIIGEPSRSLENPAFQRKMALLVLALITTFVLQRPLGREPAYWELTANRRWLARGLAVLSLVCWCCIIFNGRWIAYMNTFE